MVVYAVVQIDSRSAIWLSRVSTYWFMPVHHNFITDFVASQSEARYENSFLTNIDFNIELLSVYSLFF